MEFLKFIVNVKNSRDDDDAIEEIKSLPGQARYGVNRIEELIKPVSDNGLQSVLLFGVPIRLPKVELHAEVS